MIKAIETRYAGCHFRSRLEARWAVFFDTLGIPWEYEPQGFEWDAQTARDGWMELRGGRYLPDFWLPSIKTWFEVKGSTPTEDESRIHSEFAVLVQARHVCAFGPIPTVEQIEDVADDSMLLSDPLGGDTHYQWCVCPWCGKAGIEFDGRGARVCGYQAHDQPYEDKSYTYDDPMIVAAYNAARSARFEHGQSGAT